MFGSGDIYPQNTYKTLTNQQFTDHSKKSIYLKIHSVGVSDFLHEVKWQRVHKSDRPKNVTKFGPSPGGRIGPFKAWKSTSNSARWLVSISNLSLSVRFCFLVFRRIWVCLEISEIQKRFIHGQKLHVIEIYWTLWNISWIQRTSNYRQRLKLFRILKIYK